MIVLNVDLDNTIIYSYKHDIGPAKIEVELYHGRNISFITKKTHELLEKIKDWVLIVPTTTRTIEQYERVDLLIGELKYALVCNGGILLVHGKMEDEWYKESLALVEESREAMLKAAAFLEKDTRRTFEVRFIKELFVFTKCDEPEMVVKELAEFLDQKPVDVFNNGTKVYVVPKSLTKGKAVERFRKYIGADQVIAAGDSEFDISMFEKADISFAPGGLGKSYALSPQTKIMPGADVFSEELLADILEMISSAL